MIIFKTVLTDKQIEDYKRPEGTKTYECGAGLNCAFCSLKMLGVYNPDLEEKSKTCGPRFRSGKPVSPEEYITAIKQVIADVTEEHHEFAFAQEIGDPSVSLAKIAGNLQPLEACYFIYGRYGVSTHAVVLRKNREGEVELIDPQRGSDDVGKESGFTAERAAELGVELTPQYYRVRGIPEIEAVMVEQSVFFKYWPSKEALFNDLPHFVIACLMVDSVVGLKMLIDDRDTSKLMEVEDMQAPSPNSNPPMDVEAESEMEMEGGGGNGTTIPVTPARVVKLEKGERLDRKKMDTLLFEGETTDTAEDAVEESDENPIKYTDEDADLLVEMITQLLSPDKPDTDGNILTRLVELYISEEEEEELEETEEEVKPEQQGGGPTVKDTIANEVKKKTIFQKGSKDFVDDSFELFDRAFTLLEFPRSEFSTMPTAGQECEGVDKILGDSESGLYCWLCDSPTQIFGKDKIVKNQKSDIIKKVVISRPWPNVSTCGRIFNRPECEHLLPAKMMYAMDVMYDARSNKTYANNTLMRELYDNSCKSCNGIKGDKRYIMTEKLDGPYIPHAEHIIQHAITFFNAVGKGNPSKCDGNLAMNTIPAELQTYAGIVAVTDNETGERRLYPNVIRASFNKNFPYSEDGKSRHYLANPDKAKKVRESTSKMIVDEFFARNQDAVASLMDLLSKMKTLGFNRDKTGSLKLETKIRDTVFPVYRSNPHEDDTKELKGLRSVNYKLAVHWTLNRYCSIFSRMNKVCKQLQSDNILKKAYDRTAKGEGPLFNSASKEDRLIQAAKKRAIWSAIARNRALKQLKNDHPKAVKKEDADEIIVIEDDEGESEYLPDFVDRDIDPVVVGIKRSREPVSSQESEVERADQAARAAEAEVIRSSIAKRPRIVGGEQHLDISVHRGGRRVIEVDL